MWLQIVLDILTILTVVTVLKKGRIVDIGVQDKRLWMQFGLLALTVAIFYYVICRKGYSVMTVLNLALVFTILLLAAAVDCKCQKIPNSLVLAGFLGKSILLGIELIQKPECAAELLAMSAAGCIASLVLLLLLSALTRHGIGYGDVKLFAMIGYAMGIWDAYSILFYSALFAACYGGYLLLVVKAGKEHKMPFAPFVFAGMYAVCLFTAG